MNKSTIIATMRAIEKSLVALRKVYWTMEVLTPEQQETVRVAIGKLSAIETELGQKLGE